MTPAPRACLRPRAATCRSSAPCPAAGARRRTRGDRVGAGWLARDRRPDELEVALLEARGTHPQVRDEQASPRAPRGERGDEGRTRGPGQPEELVPVADTLGDERRAAVPIHTCV